MSSYESDAIKKALLETKPGITKLWDGLNDLEDLYYSVLEIQEIADHAQVWDLYYALDDVKRAINEIEEEYELR